MLLFPSDILKSAYKQTVQHILYCCLQQAIEDEGGDPDEIPVASELTKRMPKRTSKGTKSRQIQLYFIVAGT